MHFEERPELPLTPAKKALAAVGILMFSAQTVAALIAAPETTGTSHVATGWFVAMWAGCVAWSTVTALLVVRQADLPDVATASFIVTIAACAAFALSAAYSARGTDAQVNLVDALFIGVTGGALTSLIVWGLALGIARLLRLPTTEGIDAPG
ncbi:MAG TPA: hypothetical protein VFY79_11975 [Dehalococcoidia bacterium]|jgi:hypothetical protein|nr:hypothetical protein [Dehalococcoidia bacterium]